MKAPEHIVIFHPAAIGDAMLATPVAAILKRNFQKANITYWTHSSLKPLIKDMCPSVDHFVDYERGKNIFILASRLKSFKADLFVDLSGSSKGKLMAMLSGSRSLHYKKKPDGRPPIQHAVDNFVDTVRSSVTDIPNQLFPTIFPDPQMVSSLMSNLPQVGNRVRIGLVPGVGRLRPNRAWTTEGFQTLIEIIHDGGTYAPVLIGGPDEVEVGEKLEAFCKDKVINLCGKLDLAATAIVLKQCRFVISGDTGPAHISVAVGTKVIGLYGPTSVERSGPYGCRDLAIDKWSTCRCRYEKQCNLTPPGTAGDCMAQITPSEVLAKIETIK